MKKLLIAVMAVVFLSGCMMTPQHRRAVRDDSGDRMTVGKVQKEIRVGMSGAEVAQVLGSPNIVSTDEERREVWIYDKISTEDSILEPVRAVLLLSSFVGLTDVFAWRKWRTVGFIRSQFNISENPHCHHKI